MLEVLRNMWRRKFRTLLTVLGIAVGIFAFTVMGSLALKLNKMIDGGKKYITGQITIMPKGTSFTTMSAGSSLPLDVLNGISKVEGVEAVAGGIELPLEEPDPDNPMGGAVNMGVPPTIEGTDTNSSFENRNWKTLEMKDGRMLQKGDSDDKITIGYTISLDKSWHVGDKVTIRGRQFEVIGVVEKTMTGPDSYVFMPIKPARELLIEATPFLKSLKEQQINASSLSSAALAKLPAEARDQLLQAKAFKEEDLSTMASVSWKDGADPEAVSNRIKEQFKESVLVLSPKAMGDMIDKASSTMNAIIFGAALLALIVGSFSIINTMVMSISERTKEIGIKKAIGASRFAIARDYTIESGIIGLFGGVIGIGLGLIMIVLVNNKYESKGAELFSVEPNFFIAVAIFSFCLGIIAGILPALRAANLKIVDAIREM
jgi:putative ABC transport system permease protein